MDWQAFKQRARALKLDVVALAVSLRDKRTPWYAKALIACVVAYALSPIDLIPDFIPVLGLLDDLLLLPLGVYVCLRLVPPEVIAYSRSRAALPNHNKPTTRWAAAVLIVAVWLAVLSALTWWLWRRYA